MIGLWDAAAGKFQGALAGHSGHVNSIAFPPDGRTLASGSDDQTVKLWNVATGQTLGTLAAYAKDPGKPTPVSSVAFSPDGRSVAASSGNDVKIKLWDVLSGHLLQTFKSSYGGMHGSRVFTGRRTLATGGFDNSIKLWDITTGGLVHNLVGHSYWVEAIAFSP